MILPSAALLIASAALATSNLQVPAPNPQQAYVKRATWVETMLATRANCVAWAKTAKDGHLADTSIPAIWAKINADFRAECAWFRQDLPGVRYLDWFLHAYHAHFEDWIIRLVAKRLGDSGNALIEQIAILQKTKVLPSDPRWLELYVRARRFEDFHKALRGIWLGDLRRVFQEQADAMLRTPSPGDDARWVALTRQAVRSVDTGVVAHVGSIDQLRSATDILAAALPGHVIGASGVRRQLDKFAPRWRATLAALLRSDAEAFGQLPQLYEQVRATRRALLASLTGPREFLATWAQLDLEGEWERQFVALQHDLGNRAQFERFAPQTLRRDALIFPEDRDPADVVLRRTAALAAALQSSAAPKLAPLSSELADLQKTAAKIPADNAEARYVLYAEACRLRRQIALANPLLSIDRLLFIKRHLAIYNHMCDQFYGIAARPGGALCVLESPFTPNAKVRDLLAGSVVERGRLKGEKLGGGPNRDWQIRYDGMGNLSGEETDGGSFLSPDVSFDGRQVAFAYVECRGDREHRTHTDPARGHWAEGRCYHVFKVAADGSQLEQLTDGTWNDFDPCFMPSGRIAFISERRGGYLRCGRICPTFTVYDMAANGDDIRCLSFHETNEWQPSVTHEGMIIYTRWDYVDRHSMVAHHPWLLTPDGRDPRAVQGNYTDRRTRPDFESDLRAIPGSHRFVATASPHHGQSFGSLVLIDPRAEDDDQMSALRRITPDVGFPESQGGNCAYGEPWPLSEDFHLCVYDAAAEVPELGKPGKHGIYLVDSFGNKELIYRDAQIGCHSPMPLAPRPTPPVVNEPSGRFLAGKPAEATVGVVNVYHTRRPWPDGTKIAALRVCQVLPLSVGSAATTHNTGLQIPQSFSINIARSVLGTVPVESDGSAYFVLPAGKEVYFQALDQDGLAVTSMRSGTQFQPGEMTTCQGCHEPRTGSPPLGNTYPLAMRRPPSSLRPDVDGTDPFSYPRLVQPVLDKHCVACHKKDADKAPPLDSTLVARPSAAFMDRPTVYYASYLSLVPKFGFYDYGHQLHTIPGRFGARAAPLYQLLRKGHYDVKLSPEEMHRIAVWLDCLSIFYGVYEKEGGAAQLRGEIARPTLE